MEAFEYQLSNEPILIDTLAAYPGTLQEEYSFHNTTFTAELTPRPDADILSIPGDSGPPFRGHSTAIPV